MLSETDIGLSIAVPQTSPSPCAAWVSPIENRLAYVQLKDATADGPALVGAGDVPLEAVRTVLAGYEGWWSLEWEKAWYPDIAPLSEALVSARSWLPH